VASAPITQPQRFHAHANAQVINQALFVDACDSGYEFSAAEDGCVPCAIGFFRDKLIHSTCQVCPDADFITAAPGATAEADCNIGE